MKQTLTPSGLRGGYLFVAASASRFARLAAFLVALLVLAPTSSTAQIGLIDTFISGPTEACQNQLITYRPGPDACNSVYWKVIYNDTRLALGVEKVGCADGSSYYAYTAYDLSAIEIGTQLFAGRCGGLDFLGSTSSLPIKFKLNGKYKIETEAYGKKNGYPSACQNATKTVYVGMQAVGNISGPTSIACSDTRSVSYSIPPVPGANSYTWSITNGSVVGLLNPTISNGGATITYGVAQSSGNTPNSTISVTVASRCAGEAAVTRSITVNRYAVGATITPGLPAVLCRGNRYELRANNANNCRWVFNYYSSTGTVIQSNTSTGFVTTLTVPTDTRVAYMNYMLYYDAVCTGQASQMGSGASISSTGCTPGARLAVQSEENVPAGAHPNPVSGVLTVHVPGADGDGGFTARLRDGLQRAALTGSTPSATLRMDVSRLPAGVYLLQTTRPSGAVTTQKVLVIH